MGYTIAQKRGNDRADVMAKRGRDQHAVQQHILTEYEARLRAIGILHGHMLSTLTLIKGTPEYNTMKAEREARGNKRPGQQSSGHSRRKADKPDHKSKHDIQQAHDCEFCSRCGRVAANNLAGDVRDNVWRPECEPRPLFARALRNGHAPTLSAKPTYRMQAWSCSVCGLRANNLLSKECHGHAAQAARLASKRTFFQVFGWGDWEK